MTTYDPKAISYENRLTRVEALLESVLMGQERLEKQFNARFDHFERRYDAKLEKISELQNCIDDDLTAHRLEDGENFKQLKQRALQYIVITIIGALLGAVLVNIIGG